MKYVWNQITFEKRKSRGQTTCLAPCYFNVFHSVTCTLNLTAAQTEPVSGSGKPTAFRKVPVAVEASTANFFAVQVQVQLVIFLAQLWFPPSTSMDASLFEHVAREDMRKPNNTVFPWGNYNDRWVSIHYSSNSNNHFLHLKRCYPDWSIWIVTVYPLTFHCSK